VLEENQDVIDTALKAEVNQLRLETKPLFVRNAPEIEILNHGCFDCSEATVRARRATSMGPL
jgi:hypothetical protein